jgi:hypothetical protein
MLKKSIIECILIAAVPFLLFSCGESSRENKKGESIFPIFKKIPSSQSGITFSNTVAENYTKNNFDAFAYVYNGGGVAIGDVNNDGLQDVYLTGNDVPNKLYLNEGKFRFKDITEEAGVNGGLGWDNGVTMADVNSDGLVDIYVCKGGWRDTDEERRNLLYINQGNLNFKEQAKEYGLDDRGYSMHATFFDMDNDNDLDIYISSRPDSFFLGLSKMVSGKRNPPDNCRNKLYRNDNNTFVEIGKQAGIGQTYGYALAVVNADLNNDGYEDIFIANDYADNDYMFINQKNGTFKDEIKTATNHLSLFSMGADIADINNDGLEDILVMEMLPENYKRSKVSMPRMDVAGFWAIVDSGFQKQYMHNSLHLNHGNLFFSDVSQMAGVSKTEWSWSTLASDFNNDGHRDIFVANGYRRDIFDGDVTQRLNAHVSAMGNKYSSMQEYFEKNYQDFIEIYDPIKVRNYLFKNTGNLHFENVAAPWGLTDSTFSNGAAVADFDNDGDLDLLINNLDEEALLYENTTDKTNNFLKIKLEGPEKNTDGIGAKVSLYYDGKMQQFFGQKTVRGYLSSNDPSVHFGLGTTKMIDSIFVRWPDGKESILRNVSANQTMRVNHKNAVPGIDRLIKDNVLFKEGTETLLSHPFKHTENTFDEYKDQILLPHMFSRSGPFMASGDVNKDGFIDFYIGGAAGQAGTLYLQSNSKLIRQKVAAFESDKVFEDMGSTLFDFDKDGDLDLYVVSGGSEFNEGSELYRDRLYINDGKGNFSRSMLLQTTSSGSCVITSDFDEDGDIDLFRGGHVVPHGYPKPPRSYLFINEKGKFIDKTPDLAPSLLQTGMVNSAVWTDLNGDKKNELIVTGEWMPIKIYEYASGRYTEATEKYGLGKTEGWWNKLVADDLDGDGDIDIIAGNLGENYKFKASISKPFEVFAKDFDNNSTNDIFLAKYNEETLVPVRGRECTSQQCPMIAEKFPSFLSFAESDLKTILGEDIKTALHYQAHLFSSVILVNENGKFTITKLPLEAQLSTVNCIIPKDFDGDGKKDILIAGNKFDVEVETTPADASPGLFLKGLGNLKFQSTKPLESGFFVPYNVKDMQSIETGDGLIILVTSNNDKLRAFKLLSK